MRKIAPQTKRSLADKHKRRKRGLEKDLSHSNYIQLRIRNEPGNGDKLSSEASVYNKEREDHLVVGIRIDF
ncbi:hypothetical protein CEXT_108511 [Caerostris extrusa]|uniref:Uncharacterized protein n=1 Tax=Caerostris extrusa TaxID=172846 RepID=A0AAV4SVP1_CAEEX|nr:hypothetical protein CEXT_108511 [Caerostris extrusa]